jgi:hypothetical protein
MLLGAPPSFLVAFLFSFVVLCAMPFAPGTMAFLAV